MKCGMDLCMLFDFESVLLGFNKCLIMKLCVMTMTKWILLALNIQEVLENLVCLLISETNAIFVKEVFGC